MPYVILSSDVSICTVLEFTNEKVHEMDLT